MATETEIDVLVVGGGPAGSTCAAVLAKYNPGLRVVLAEQSAFPRHHIGESLILELNRVLRDMGALDRVAAGGFLKKGGATFVWGHDRTPWSLRFEEGAHVRRAPGEPLGHTWHVERGRYDGILLETARAHGVTVLQPARVTALALEPGCARATVVEADGRTHAYRARYCVDAGGRNGPLVQKVGQRVYDPVLRNVALYGYWQGARLDPAYAGDWDLSLISVIAIPAGWVWYIPIAPGVVSVGVVTSHANYKARPDVPREDWYLDMLRTSPEVTAWLADARRVPFAGAGDGVLVESDFNYTHSQVAGDSWALVGDAAGFVDPLFSIGVFLSQTGGQLLGYTLGTALSGEGDAPARRLLDAYDHHMRGYLGAFRSMAYVFYGFNASKEVWWKKTHELIRAEALPGDIGDREAFMALTFGFGVNVSLFHEAISCFGQMAAPRIRAALLGAAAEPRARDDGATPALAPGARPRLVRGYQSVPSTVPAEGTGRVIPMSRVELAPRAEAHDHSAFPRHVYVPDELVPLLAQVDGAHTTEALLARAQALLAHREDLRPKARELGAHLLRALAGFGALG